MSKLYIVTLVIYLICSVHHAKCQDNESQAGIKIAGRNINNLRYADDTTLMAESEEELKNFLMNVQEESEKAGLKLNIEKLRSWHLFLSLLGKPMVIMWKQCQISFSWVIKSIWMVTAATELKDACSLKE